MKQLFVQQRYSVRALTSGLLWTAKFLLFSSLSLLISSSLLKGSVSIQKKKKKLDFLLKSTWSRIWFSVPLCLSFLYVQPNLNFSSCITRIFFCFLLLSFFLMCFYVSVACAQAYTFSIKSRHFCHPPIFCGSELGTGSGWRGRPGSPDALLRAGLHHSCITQRYCSLSMWAPLCPAMAAITFWTVTRILIMPLHFQAVFYLTSLFCDRLDDVGAYTTYIMFYHM